MSAMAKLRPAVDAFFDKVKVNDDDAAVRENRLKLLNEIRAATRAVADFFPNSGLVTAAAQRNAVIPEPAPRRSSGNDEREAVRGQRGTTLAQRKSPAPVGETGRGLACPARRCGSPPDISLRRG